LIILWNSLGSDGLWSRVI